MDSEERKRLFEKHEVTPGDLVNHLFLPKRLPQSEEPRLINIELAILEYLNLTSAETLDRHNLSAIRFTLESWIAFESGKTSAKEILSNLKNGERACFYVRMQNCTIHFTKLKHEHMRVITFRSSLPNELVTGTSGSLKVTYPETTHVVPISKLLVSECFSNQLNYLSKNLSPIAMAVTVKAGESHAETREPSFPYVVSEFLVGMLCPEDPKEFEEIRPIKFQKKLRDQVNWDSCDVPFRRSGMWMSIKVILQMSLNEKVSCMEASVLYKVLILKMLEYIAVEYTEREDAAWDITAQILVKLARRVKKLSGMGKCKNVELESLRNDTVNQVLVTIDHIHKKVSKQWQDTEVSSSEELEVRKITRSKINWTNDCIHKIDLSKFRDKILHSRKGKLVDNLKMIDPVFQISGARLDSLLVTYKNISSGDLQDVHVNNQTVWIHHVEWFVRNGLNNNLDCSKIFDLLLAYTKTVFPLYGETYSDPLYFSRMAITVLKVVAVLDEIAVTKHPVLRAYSTGIQPEMFECLLIPDYRDMLLVEMLQSYFRMRNANADHPDWLATSDVTRNSFPVTYAQGNQEMIRLKAAILQDSEVKIRQKKEEIKRVREQCSELQVRVNSCVCTYTWSSYRERKVHDTDCARCKLTTQLLNKRYSVDIYQRPLPPEEYLRDAIVFELLIPREIAHLRDGACIVSEVFGYDLLSPKLKVENIDTKWMEFGELGGYSHSGFQKLVHVGSELKDMLSTHYGRSNPDVHSSESSFVVENGLNCKIYKVGCLIDDEKPLKNPFTLQIHKTCPPMNDSYNSLQFSLNVKRPTENEVIANQYKCHQNISVKEFITFGSMRCGHNIQLRNLFAAIANQELPLHHEPVLTLIMQTVWELGPGRREIYVDFERESMGLFCKEFLELLKTRSGETSTNWSNPIGLLSLVVITVKILEMTESVRVKESAGELLQVYREVIEKWCVKLEDLISNSKDEEENVLMEILLKCAICSAFTFNVSTELLTYAFNDPSDLTFWMNSLTRLHHLVVRQNVLKNSNLSSFMQNLLRHARVTIPLNVQDHLHGLLEKDLWNKALHTFVCSKWADATKISERDIPTFQHSGNGYPEKKHAYQANYNVSGNIHPVCVDILRGAFFVDGFPPSLLPESIIRNPLFRTFFRNSKFHVQRNSKTFKTENKYRGHHFEFTETDDRLVIRQVSTDGYLELLPRELFKKKVPRHLIHEFTHWIDSKDKVVYFRRISCDDDPLEIENDTDYVLMPCDDTLEEWHLVKYKQTDLYFLSINSPGFKTVTHNLEKLESKKFIHVIFEEKREKGTLSITAKLLRMNMVFSLNQDNGLLYCDKYPEYYVPVLDGQNLDTLVGLESGLVLEKITAAEASGKKRLLLIQHGTVEITQKNTTKHQTVLVTGHLRNPPYFAFTIDQVLQRLHAGNTKSAWLYLAALHAATSSPFPDPFTQLTGAEMSLYILQSAYVWSCSPYDQECVNTLEQIGLFSPEYSYYPNHMTNMIKMKWPPGLEMNSYAAYDGYAIIVDRLFKDCSRFKGLFQKKFKIPEKLKKINLNICKRSYFRHVNVYNAVAHLKPDFIEDIRANGKPSTLDCYGESQENYDQLVTLAEIRRKRIRSCFTESVGSLIMTSEPLPHNINDELKCKFLNDWFVTCVREDWLQLYTLSRDSTLEHELTIIFGAMIYSGKGSLNQVLNLHNITLIHKSNEDWGKVFPEPVMSLTNESYQPLNHTFIPGSITRILKEAADEPPSKYDFSTHAEYVNADDEYRRSLDRQTENAVERVRCFWPGESLSVNELSRTIGGERLLNATTECYANINELMVEWKNNLNLKGFVIEVDRLLEQGLENVEVEVMEFKSRDWDLKYLTVADGKDKWVEGQWSFEDIVSTKVIGTIVDDAKRIFVAGKLPNSQLIPPEELRHQCNLLVDKIVGELNDRVIGKCAVKMGLRNAGIHLTLPPVVLVRDYLVKWKDLKDGPLAYMVGCLAVLWANIKRCNRLINYQQNHSKYAFELEKELKTVVCENWSPLEFPEWLALELELDITIRPIQVQVARHMMSMPGNKNGVMQLNMGEGKTSVIAPMVVSTLSKTGEMLCRVTVLNSIFATNENLLAFAVGGFVGKRVYTVPCGRDLKITKYLKEMKNAYEECVTRGVVITLPEYRLSFRLQMYNSFLEGKYEDGHKMYGLEHWLRVHARDIVDESDEVFNVKYQLIYTTGKQVQVDGGSMRWRVCQKYFELLPGVAETLVKKYGEDVVEFQSDVGRRSPQQFRPFRILDDGCKEYFNGLVADGILNGEVDLLGQILTMKQQRVVKEYLVNEHISEEDHGKFDALGLPSGRKEILLLVSGYLRRGILFTALRKRWRVEYGVKETKDGIVIKWTAVPFRAKDKAAERTEFGHPDMAIVLTLLSYYRSGLSDEQMLQCFDLLESTVTGPEGVYNAWIRKVTGEISETIRTYGGVNLQDYEQRTEYLFPVLRFHKDVIDFWLSNVAFPKECKQFPGKLVTNAWDLCYERCGYPTTGFSGTNDTSLLLPAQITQQDLQVLMDTNEKMEKILMGGENQYRRSLGMGVTCREVLQFMIEDGLRVLIDAGALMLELGNEEIAELWLELDKDLGGVVYFNKKGEMVVKLRGHGYKNRKKYQLLSLSCVHETLDQFAVYLDDQHTRGTDLKLPSDFKACVTVGSGMRRDKLIQACWRMRKLGEGQSVHFYLSQEVHNKVSESKLDEGRITTHDILKWVKSNSKEFEKEGLVYWAMNAITYGKNLAAEDLFEMSGKCEEDACLLGKRCEDPDAQSLEKMYGAYLHQVPLVDLIPVWFSDVVKRLTDGRGELSINVVETLDAIETKVLEKCTKHIPSRMHFYVLEEEQEKELEPEQQEQVEKYRPQMEDPVKPVLHDYVVRIINGSWVPCVVDGVLRLSGMFKDTKVWSNMCEDGWRGEWYVTKDFVNVIKFKNGDNLDSFLRRSRYFVSFKVTDGTVILVLSQFEVNEMITRLRDRNCADNVTLHMFTGRWVDGQSSFANSPRLQLPLDLTGRGIKVDENVIAPLLIAAGNLYFESMEEQRAFARFLGLAFRPWKDEQKRAHAEGMISTTGFVSPDCPGLRVGCNFQSDPTDFVRRVLGVRNDVVMDGDHVVMMLDRCAFLSLE